MAVQFAILRYLSEQARHGFGLQRLLPELRHFYPLSNVNVYPLLKGMEEDGFVESRTEMVSGRARKIYEITERGRSAFSSWLMAEPEQRLPAVRDPVGLRFALAPADSSGLGWLDDAIEETTAELEAVRHALEAEGSSLTPLALLAREEIVESLARRVTMLRTAKQIAG